MKIAFLQNNKAQWGNQQQKISDCIGDYLTCKHEIELTNSEMEELIEIYGEQ